MPQSSQTVPMSTSRETFFNDFEVTREAAQIQQLLAPLVPTAVWCIGQNYRGHADETGIGTYKFPVVFAKGKKGGGHSCRGKSFDTFAPIGPCLVTRESIPNPNALPPNHGQRRDLPGRKYG
jgi:2-keto-4-pentenoate hydratase/2-oxohepta-3-ene-1,7-dioic acid hydratase in catechol pathway